MILMTMDTEELFLVVNPRMISQKILQFRLRCQHGQLKSFDLLLLLNDIRL